MRLGGVALAPQSVAEIEAFCDKADAHGISAVVAPKTIGTMSEDECIAFGQAAKKAGLVIGETGFWENLITQDKELRADRMRRLKSTLRNADLMGCRSVAILTGTRHESDKAFAAHPYMFTDACKAEVRDIVLEALDGFESKTTRLGLEPYALAFIDSVGHPLFGIHLDQANMIGHADFYRTTDLIDRTFEMLAPHMVSVHLKDLDWPVSPLGIQWREVDFEEGVMDFDRYFARIATLDPDICCFCEHFATEDEYFRNFERAHAIAARGGLEFIRR